MAQLVAAISLVDGAAMLAAGAWAWALWGVVGFVMTLRLQRRVRGA